MSQQHDDKPESLRESTLSGVRWLAVSRVISESLALVAAVALARLLSPAEFGRAAVALILLPLGVILTFEGFASALVQRPSIDRNDQRAAMFMCVAGGLVLTGLVLVLTGPVWKPLFGARTAALIELMAPALAISSLGGVSRAILWRRLDWARMSMIDVASLLVGNVVAVALAAAGFGARAMVLGALVQATATTALMLIAAPPPLPAWNPRAQRQIAAFGVPASLAGLVDSLFRNIDYAILASRLSAAQTGLYYRAFNLGVVYQDKLSRVMMQIAFPVYSRTTDRDELRRLHERAARVHAAVIFPCLTLLIVLAPVLVPFVFGAQWTPAVRPTQILALAGMMAAILTGYPQVMLAVGKPRALLLFNIGVLVTYATAIWVAVGHGLIVVAIAVVLVYLLILIGAYRLLLQRHAGIALNRLIPELGPAVVACLGLAVVSYPLMQFVEPLIPRVTTIVLVGAIGPSVYGAIVYTFFRATWDDLWLLATRILPPLGRLARRPAASSVRASSAVQPGAAPSRAAAQ
jgi:lipopolysaccharide exporter